MVFKERAMSQACTSHWQLPGGKMGYGENVKDAVVKKIKEYINLNIEANQIVPFVPSVVTPETDADFEFVVIPIMCTVIGGEMKLKEGKIREARYFSLEEMKVLNDDNLLVDKDLEIAEHILANYK